MRLLAAVTLTTLVALAPGTSARADDAKSSASTLEAGLQRIAVDRKFKGARLRYEPTRGEPLEVKVGIPETSVALGDVSRSVTGIGIALLIQQDKLRLDSTLGNVLADYFARHGTPLDASLRPVTIERLLTYRAGIRPNVAPDRNRGLSALDVTTRIGGTPHFFNYLTTAKVGSSGRTAFAYSNLTYVLLGAVIEAVSGETYEAFCQRNIFRPLGITTATIPRDWTVVSPIGGWRMTLADLLLMWTVFDVRRPSVLTAETLRATLLGGLGGPVEKGTTVYYTLGVYVRQDRAGGPYVVTYNGLAEFTRRTTTEFAFVEKFVPGYAWAIAGWPGPREQELLDVTAAVAGQTRPMLEEIDAKK